MNQSHDQSGRLSKGESGMNNEEEFEEDPRFKQCNREFYIVLVLFVVNILLVSVPAMALGQNKSADEISFVLGLPAWFFWGGIVGSLVFIVLSILMVRFFFKDMSLEAEDEGVAA